MPIYEYECGVCQHRFERKQRFDEEPVAMCPKCEGKAYRIIHSVPVIFKGSGFYVTDHPKSDSGSKSRKVSRTPGKEGEKETVPGKDGEKETVK